MYLKNAVCLLALMVVGVSTAAAQDLWSADRPDAHAPIGVVGDHTHYQDEWMVSYRYTFTRLEGLLDGTTLVAVEEILDPLDHDFGAAPLEMSAQRHMLGAMYAPVDRVTVVALLPFVMMSMHHQTIDGTVATVESSGIGDTRVAALVDLWRADRQQIHGKAGISLPTGSTVETGDMPMTGEDEARLPYLMQPGSGTFDLMPGATYRGQTEHWSWAVQGAGVYRLGENAEGYRLGHQVQATVWGARRLMESFSVSTRFEASLWGNIEGQSEALESQQEIRSVPTVFEDHYAGERLDAGLGLNYYLTEGPLSGLRVGLEGTAPVFQSLDGPQLARDFELVVGLQHTF